MKAPIVKERVRAISDYTATSPNDLSFKAGDIIEVCGPSGVGNWWLHGWMPNKGFGIIPYNFVESLEDEFPDAEEGSTLFTSLSPVVKALRRFRVLQDVVPTEEDALSLRQGDIIDFVERQSHEKWIGRVKSLTGTFRLDNSIVSSSPLKITSRLTVLAGTNHDRSRHGNIFIQYI